MHIQETSRFVWCAHAFVLFDGKLVPRRRVASVPGKLVLRLGGCLCFTMSPRKFDRWTVESQADDGITTIHQKRRALVEPNKPRRNPFE